jgi:protein phosphatase PTC7
MQYKDKALHSLVLGDSGFIILRRGMKNRWFLVYKSKEQQHRFNCPYQLSRIPTESDIWTLESQGLTVLADLVRQRAFRTNDSAYQALFDKIPIQLNDLIIAGTDGLFDNMSTSEIIPLVESHFLQTFDSDRAQIQSLAERLARQAATNALDGSYKSPFAMNAARNGMAYSGGKPDDTTVVVSYAVQDPQITLNA